MSDNPLIIVKPITVTDTMLTACTVPETDYAEYAAGTTYALGARVIIAANHKVYESLQASNVGHAPASNPTWWAEVSPTNRWKLFDTANSTQTVQATSMSYTVLPGQAINSVALLNLTGVNSVRVRLVDPTFGTVYDRTTSVSPLPVSSSWWEWWFGSRVVTHQLVLTDLPAYPNASVVVDVFGTTSLAVGVLLLGQWRQFGLGVQAGARVSIQDYSRKETNDFGDVVFVQRAYAKRASFAMLIEKDEVDSVQSFLADLRAVPCLWVGSDEYESTVVYGWYSNFEILISYPTYSECNLDIEGLT